MKYCCIALFIHLILVVQLGTVFGQSRVPLLDPGVSAFLSGEYGECLDQYIHYLKNQDELQDQERHALFLRLAYIAAWEERDKTSIALLKDADALEDAGIIPDSTAISDRYLVEAISAYGQAKLTDASDLLAKSAQLRGIENRFEKSILADTYGFLGLVYKELEDFEKAIRYYKEAIRLDRELKRSFVMANELTELASSRMAIDPFDSEIDTWMEEALEIFSSLDNYSGQAYVNNEYCVLYQERRNLPKALEYILKTASIKESIQDDDNLDVTYNNIGALYEEMNYTDSSILYIHKAINTAKKLRKNTRGEYFSNLGARFGNLGYLDSAIYYFNKAIQQIMPHSLSDDPDATFFSIVNPQLPGYIAKKANAFYESFHKTGNLDDLKQSILSYNIALKQLDTLRFLYSFENKPHTVKENRKYYFLALQSAAEYYEQTGETADLETAFLLASRSKALVFDEYMRVSEARGFLDIDPDLIRRVDSLKMQKAAALQKAYEVESSTIFLSDSISKYSSPVFEIEEALNVLDREIKERNPAYYQSIHTMPAFSSDLIRSRLTENELLLDFSWHKNQLIIMTIGSDIFKMHHFEVPQNLRELLGTYRNFLEGQHKQLSYNQFKEYSQNLYQLLLKPFESQIGDKNLYIIADDSLALLPFETLLFKASNESRADYSKLPFLLNKNPISYYHSIQQFVLNTERDPIFSPGISAFAPFNKLDYNEGGNKLNKLQGSAEEVKVIKKHFPTRIFRSISASEAHFRSALRTPRIIHVATHGLQADSAPLQNHLLFYPKQKNEDYKFHLFELLGLQIESPLVVLSSCNTGAGTLQAGEGVLSLARAFHFAGTPALIMSQWPVDDAVAVIIMNEFYSGLEKGYPLNRALQQAKLLYLNEAGTSRSNPYYWASFQLTGYSGPIIVKEYSEIRWILPVGAGISLSLIILLIIRPYIKKKRA